MVIYMRTLKKLFKISMFLLLFLTIIVISVYGYSKLSPKLEIEKANNIIFYDNDNNIFLQGNGGTEWVSLDEISDK